MAEHRDSLARDPYDLAWTASRPFDEAMVRRLLVPKIWTDGVDGGPGRGPYGSGDILRDRSADEFEPEAWATLLRLPTSIAGSLPRVVAGPTNTPFGNRSSPWRSVTDTRACLYRNSDVGGLDVDVEAARISLPLPHCWTVRQVGTTARHAPCCARSLYVPWLADAAHTRATRHLVWSSRMARRAHRWFDAYRR
jgi:hypothetical protein